MAYLIYSTLCSLDGYIEDQNGQFDWAAPDEEVHQFVNDQERTIGTYLLGRRMYEVMQVWETDPSLAADSKITRDYAELWQAAHKIVYSRTLKSVTTSRTQLIRNFEPSAIQTLKSTLESDISIGGPELAAHAFRTGMVDECHFYIAPIVVGGGKRALPENLAVGLTLLDEQRFKSGFIFLRYQIKPER